jgi:SAM-dependent methyltransferase
MEPIIKIDLQKILAGDEPLIIDLGCGKNKKAGAIGIDQADLPGVDIVADIEKGLPLLPDNCVDFLYCRSMLEHVRDFPATMKEIVRVLKKTGKAEIYVPHFSSPYYYSDFTHRNPFGLYTFYYFVSPENQLRRKVPDYYTDIKINIVSLKLLFRSRFWLLARLKSIFGRIINSCFWLQEYYEETLCYIVPCSGIEITFTPA